MPQINLTAINHLWVADITYIRLREEFVYLAVVLDAFSRRLPGWSLEHYMEVELALTALCMALAGREVAEGLVHHSDQGVQYASLAHTDLLKEQDIRISMSRHRFEELRDEKKAAEARSAIVTGARELWMRRVCC